MTPEVETAIRDLLHDIDKTIGDSNAYAIEGLIREHVAKLIEEQHAELEERINLLQAQIEGLRTLRAESHDI